MLTLLLRRRLRRLMRTPAPAARLTEEFVGEAIEILTRPRFLKLPRYVQFSFLGFVKDAYGRTYDRTAPRMAEVFGRIFHALLRSGAAAMGDLLRLYDMLYFLHWCASFTIEQQRGFDENVVRPFSAYLREKLPVNPIHPREPGAKIRLCYMAQYLYDGQGNGHMSVVEGCLSGLREHFPDRYELFLYAWMYWQPSVIERMKSRGIEVRCFDLREYAAPALAELRERFAQDRIDVAITDMNSSVPHYLFESRFAPVQVFYQLGMPFWSIRGIDRVFLAWNTDPGVLGFSPEICRVLSVPAAHPVELPPVEPGRVRKERERFPAGAHTIGCYGRLIKVTPEYLDLVCRILERSPGTIAAIGGTGDAALIRDFIRQRRLEERVFVVDEFVDGHVWGHFLDIFLDTFPLAGGYSCRETMAKGKPVVHVGFHEQMNLNEMLDPEMRCASVGEYEEKVVRLLKEPEYYAAARARALETSNRKADPRAFAARFHDAVQEAVR